MGLATIERFLHLLACPATREPLTILALPGSADGLLATDDRKHVYPVISGVPVLLPFATPKDFVERHRRAASALGVDLSNSIEITERRWSFSNQWAMFEQLGVERTWGWTTEQREDMFFAEVQRSHDDLREATLLDAGCGNGQLTALLARRVKLAVGIDYSDSVFANARRDVANNLLFVRGDLQAPPFRDEAFDVVVSNGVLHHTSNTRRAFDALAPTVAPEGSFYIWLYRDSKAGNLFRRMLRKTVMGTRRFISPLPKIVHVPIVYTFAAGMKLWSRYAWPDKRYRFSELLVTAHDSLTPKYRTNHSATEVAEWYFENGFGPIILSHWDNRTGFGVVARRIPQSRTPGLNPDAPPRSVPRYGL